MSGEHAFGFCPGASGFALAASQGAGRLADVRNTTISPALVDDVTSNSFGDCCVSDCWRLRSRTKNRTHTRLKLFREQWYSFLRGANKKPLGGAEFCCEVVSSFYLVASFQAFLADLAKFLAATLASAARSFSSSLAFSSG